MEKWVIITLFFTAQDFGKKVHNLHFIISLYVSYFIYVKDQ